MNYRQKGRRTVFNEIRDRSQFTCTHCDPPKRVYPNRKMAKRAASQQLDKGKMTAYPCPGGEGFHLGHLPLQIRQGRNTRATYDGRYRNARKEAS